RGVYSTILWTRDSLFFIFGVLMAAIIGGNLVVAYMLRPPFRPMSPEQQNLQHYVLMVEPRRKLILAAIMVIALLAAGASAQGDWSMWQLWLHGTSFGVKDPQFGLDISFYAWDYPVYRSLLGFGFTAVIFSLVLSVAIHYLSGAIRLQTPGPKVTLAARRHITVLVFVFMLLKAIAYWLDRYGMVFSDRSKFTGASYTDVHSALPAKTILFWITIVLALGVLASMWLRSTLLPGIGFVVLLVLSILMGGIYPAIVQQVSVKPNASDKERPYIARNIAATRAAYDITTQSTSDPNGTVNYVTYNATGTPQLSALSESNTTIANIRILDPNLISPTFTAQQKIAVPYAFSPQLNVDRYTIGGVTHDYVVAVRELAPGSNLSGSQNNWINQHTVYTHGYGFVAAQADVDVTNGDASDYTEGGIPPSGPLGLTQPDVYYCELGNGYAIVGAKGTPREFDGTANSYNTYSGTGGISLSSFFTKAAFALKFRQTNFLLNDAVSASGARIIFNQNPITRLEKVAPFLTVDSDPYPVVDSKTGHIVWMLDGYTTMANYPYSERQSLSDLTHTTLQPGQRDTQINYIRNSVKATVDAYDGTVHLYDWDSTDPVLKTWMKVFPGLVEPKTAMPTELQSHIRYPQDLFDVQRGLLAQYHIDDPVASYNGKGKWAVPTDPFGAPGNQPPYYVLASPPGSSSNAPEFQLTTPLVVTGGTNLAAYISVDSDINEYGKLTVLQVSGQSTVYGPSQVANDLKSTAVISKDITQLGTGQSVVLHGNLLTLPVGGTFLYVEPLYVESTSSTSAFPTLQRVLVRYGNGDQIGYGATLQAALGDIINGQPAGSSIGQIGQTTGKGGAITPSGTPTSTPPSSPSSTPSSPSSSATAPPPSPGSEAQILNQLNTAYDNLNAAYNTHNPVTIAQAQQRLQELVQQLLQARSATPSGSAKPTK
ncbi:MAG: UPF0182 family protein, partial [Actinobacteria bacterium]|nr:UPF0182 family protein [Actinomycetota bacterium]